MKINWKIIGMVASVVTTGLGFVMDTANDKKMEKLVDERVDKKIAEILKQKEL